jgi:hypothetical protein
MTAAISLSDMRRMDAKRGGFQSNSTAIGWVVAGGGDSEGGDKYISTAQYSMYREKKERRVRCEV